MDQSMPLPEQRHHSGSFPISNSAVGSKHSLSRHDSKISSSPPSVQYTTEMNEYRSNVGIPVQSILRDHPPIELGTRIEGAFQSDCGSQDPSDEPFRRKSRILIIALISCSAMISGLSTNIYYPAQEDISQQLKLNRNIVNGSITTYLVLQGVAPAFWGPVAERFGRRVTLMSALLICTWANLALAFVKNGTMLVVFRACQSFGTSCTITLGAAVISDISNPSTCGGYMGLFSGLRQASMAFGPVIGGILVGFCGFRSIFWFLFAWSASCLLCVIMLLPETQACRLVRSDKANWSALRQRPLLRACISGSDAEYVTQGRDASAEGYSRLGWRLFWEPFTFLAQPDVTCALVFGALIYSAWSMMVASTSYLLKDIYHFTPLEIGLGYLANGFGCMFGSYMSGKTLNWKFESEGRLWQHSLSVPCSAPLPRAPLPPCFPIEKARLSDAPMYGAMMMTAFLVFGWSLTPLPDSQTPFNGHYIAPLIAQFVVGYSNTSVLNSNQTLIVDLYPGKSASASSITNLLRCTLAGLGVSLVDIILRAMHPGWFATLLAGIIVTSLVPYLLVWLYGEKWRGNRNSKL